MKTLGKEMVTIKKDITKIHTEIAATTSQNLRNMYNQVVKNKNDVVNAKYAID